MIKSISFTASLIVIVLFVLTMTSLKNAYSSEILKCETPTGSKSFVINEEKVTFLGRTPSSSITIRTEQSGQKFTQTLIVEGSEYQIHIDDMNAPNYVNDYLWITSKEGHKFLYPLNCGKA